MAEAGHGLEHFLGVFHATHGHRVSLNERLIAKAQVRSGTTWLGPYFCRRLAMTSGLGSCLSFSNSTNRPTAHTICVLGGVVNHAATTSLWSVPTISTVVNVPTSLSVTPATRVLADTDLCLGSEFLQRAVPFLS